MIVYKFRKTRVPVLFFLMIGLIVQSQTKTEFHSCAPKRTMGWNSWDCFGPTVKTGLYKIVKVSK